MKALRGEPFRSGRHMSDVGSCCGDELENSLWEITCVAGDLLSPTPPNCRSAVGLCRIVRQGLIRASPSSFQLAAVREESRRVWEADGKLGDGYGDWSLLRTGRSVEFVPLGTHIGSTDDDGDDDLRR